MSRTSIEAVSHEAPRPTALGSAVRTLTLAGATLTTGLIAGVFYAYARGWGCVVIGRQIKRSST
jgi:hypothetical protein